MQVATCGTMRKLVLAPGLFTFFLAVPACSDGSAALPGPGGGNSTDSVRPPLGPVDPANAGTRELEPTSRSSPPISTTGGQHAEGGGGGSPVPEPTTLFLLGSGLAGIAIVNRRRKPRYVVPHE